MDCSQGRRSTQKKGFCNNKDEGEAENAIVTSSSSHVTMTPLITLCNGKGGLLEKCSPALAVLLSCAAEVMSRSLSTAAASVSPRLIWSCRACCAESEKKVKRRFRRFRSHRHSEINLTDTVFCPLCRSHTFSSRYKCCLLRNSLHHHTLIGSTIRTYDRPQIPKLLAPLHVPSMVHLIETSSCRPSLL